MREIPASGSVARVYQVDTEVDSWDYFPLVTTAPGPTLGLPESDNDTLIIVSAMVRVANPKRKDLVSPARLIRDDAGRIIGCGALEINK